MFVIPTTAAEHLCENLKRGNLKVVYPSENKDRKRVFPDGELYVKIPQAGRLSNQHVAVLHSGAPSPNKGLIELELILQVLREVKANPIEVFFSYFPYSMQDSVFFRGETNVAETLVEKFVRYYGVKNISIIDAHFAGKEWHQKYPLRLISAVPQLLEAAARDFGEDILFLSPDKGGKRRTRIQNMKKTRKNSFEVEIQSSPRQLRAIKNRPVAVVDDLIETGGTLDRFYDECKKAGAKDVAALLTHGVLPSGISRVKKKYKKIYLTNTIDRKEANVDITPLIYTALTH